MTVTKEVDAGTEYQVITNAGVAFKSKIETSGFGIINSWNEPIETTAIEPTDSKNRENWTAGATFLERIQDSYADF